MAEYTAVRDKRDLALDLLREARDVIDHRIHENSPLAQPYCCELEARIDDLLRGGVAER